MKIFLSAIFCFLPATAFALSCAFLTPEQAKDAFPVALHGTVTASSPIPATGKEDGFIRQLQQVELQVQQAYGLSATAQESFIEAVTVYDGGSRFKQGGEYVVFLERNKEGKLQFPVCGYAFSPSQSGVEWEEISQVLGWKP